MTGSVPVTPLDKFKLVETAPFFAIGPTGSYSALSFKNVYNSKFKNLDTGSTVKTSGILKSNAVVDYSGATGDNGP